MHELRAAAQQLLRALVAAGVASENEMNRYFTRLGKLAANYRANSTQIRIDSDDMVNVAKDILVEWKKGIKTYRATINGKPTRVTIPENEER